ncbi:MAG: outer membrane lipoprotein carrier protein LolA [bacterium]|nr:outer membrane lipoprotein carrier protein LolA [bacterium]
MKFSGPDFDVEDWCGAVLWNASLLIAGLLICVGFSVPSMALDDVRVSKEKPPVNAISGSAWTAEVTPAEPDSDSSALPEDQRKLLQKINTFMQKFNDLEGQFIQTNPDNVVQKGVFYVLRPGRMRFDYARPSRLRIVSDGEYLSIEDHDLKTVNKYPLESTPFRMLLTKNVDLQRDARILALASSDTSASIKLADRSGQSAGQIQLFFSLPDIKLKEWVITDAQGLHTRIEISNLNYEKKLGKKLFAASNIALENVFGEK